jgi:hypothetical protein
MTKLTRWGGTLLAGAAVAAVACLSGGPAFAAGPVAAATWTVTPGGSVSGTAGTTTLQDSTTGTALTCTSSAATGSLKSGSGLRNPLGTIATLTFSNCTGPLGISFSTSVTGPFPLNGAAYNAGTGVTTGKISNIHGSLSGPLCSATVDGTSAGANNGMVRAHYKNSTGKLTVLATGGNLHIYNVSGCFGLINSGDTATFSGSYAISPKQAISSP